jgi:hypothetical protein
MQTIDLGALATPELGDELSNIVERGYRGLPLPGQDGYDGVTHTSDRARAVTRAMLAAVRRAGGVEPLAAVDLLAAVKRDNPGHSDEWYAAYLARRAHFASGADMSTAPSLPASSGGGDGTSGHDGTGTPRRPA